ncbi:O-antigen polymerase [Legionella sp. WA2022007384]
MKYNADFSAKYLEFILWIFFLVGVASALISYGFELNSEVIISSFYCFIIATFLASYKSGSGFFSASVVCLLAFFFYSMAVPLHHLFYGDYNESGVSFVTTMCVVGLLGQIFGYYAIGKPRFIGINNGKYESFFGFFILSLGIVILIAAIAGTVGFSAYFNAGYAGRALLKREAGPLELGLYYSIIGYLFMVHSWFYQPSKKRIVLGLFLLSFLLCFVAYVSFLGIRRPSFFMVISFLFIYFLKVKGRVPLLIVLTSLFCAFLFGIFASFRQVLSDHGASSALSYVLENFNLAWLDLSASELGAPFRSMLDVDPWFSDSFLWGRSYVDAVINLLPSSIGKFSESLSVKYTHEFFSPEYIAIGGNMGFFPVAEGYLNFGAVGVFLEFFFVGMLIKYIENQAIRKSNVVQVIVYAIMVPWFFFFLRSDLASFSKSFFYSVMPVFFAYGLYCLIKKNPQKHNSIEVST